LELINQAEEMRCETIRFHFIECFGSKDNIIAVTEGYPIGPHFKAVKWREDIGFIGSDGFNEAKGPLKRYETDYCMRHTRYANLNGIEERKRMNYFQEYFLQNYEIIPYKPNQKINYYRR
jgi:hypothetical protein